MKNHHGIVSSDHGDYILASVSSPVAGTPCVYKIKQWDSSSVLGRITLFQKGVTFGVPSCCQPVASEVDLDGMTIAIKTITDGIVDPFRFITHSTDLAIHRDSLEANLLGIVPKESFLASLPICYVKNISDSFISIFGNDELVFIGIIIKKKLNVVYRVVLEDKNTINCFIERIKRYWDIRIPDIIFPDEIVVIGDYEYISSDTISNKIHRIFEDVADDSILSAVGTALTEKEPVTPFFETETMSAKFRKKRTWIYGGAIGISAFVLCLIIGTYSLGWLFARQKMTYESEYKKVIVNNTEIKKLIDRNDDLAETILRLDKTFSHQTVWGKFFNAIGKGRPDGLFFERLQSKPVEGKEQVVRIALSGWTAKERNVTEFIAKLQSVNYVTQITLASMERDKKKRSIFGFKIKCTLLLNEQ